MEVFRAFMKKWSIIYLYIIYLIMLFRSVVMGQQVYGAIKVKAEGQ